MLLPLRLASTSTSADNSFDVEADRRLAGRKKKINAFKIAANDAAASSSYLIVAFSKPCTSSGEFSHDLVVVSMSRLSAASLRPI